MQKHCIEIIKNDRRLGVNCLYIPENAIGYILTIYLVDAEEYFVFQYRNNRDIITMCYSSDFLFD